jgi:hypothetical protein
VYEEKSREFISPLQQAKSNSGPQQKQAFVGGEGFIIAIW